MTTNFHTPVATGAAVNASTVNLPLGELDSALSDRKLLTTRIDDGDSPYAILVTDRVLFCNTDSAAVTANLPAGVEGQTFKIVNSGVGADAVSLVPNGAEELIGENSAWLLYAGETLEITYNATDGWY